MSSTTLDGLDDFYRAVEDARKEYVDDYRPELDKVIQERAEKKEKEKKTQLDRLMKDMNLAKRNKQSTAAKKDEENSESDVEPSYDGDGQLLDPVSNFGCSKSNV